MSHASGLPAVLGHTGPQRFSSKLWLNPPASTEKFEKGTCPIMLSCVPSLSRISDSEVLTSRRTGTVVVSEMQPLLCGERTLGLAARERHWEQPL
jgi:hypothetical protein